MKLTIVIRFTNSLTTNEQIKDLEIPISINLERDDVNRLVNVKWIKSLIRSKVPQCTRTRLRLIYNGKVLNELADFKKEIIEPRIRTSQGGDTGQFYIHCFIGEELTSEQLNLENELDNTPQQKTTLPEVIGFDRLLEQGFNQEDINDLRRQFMLVYGGATNGSREVDDIEELEQRSRTMQQLEERWINSTIGGSTGPTGAETTVAPTATEGEDVDIEMRQPNIDLDDINGNNEDLIIGLMFGIFLGVVSLVFIVVDDSIFNKRQKISILTGVFLNICLGLIRGEWV